jgi:hypothetical protein
MIGSLLLMSVAGLAQDGADKPQPNKGEIIEKIIIAHITKELNLSVDEAQKFWPVFNNYRTEFRTAVQNHKDDPIKRDEEVLVIKKKYKPEFQRVLNSEKRANKVFTVFEDALRRIMEKQRQRRENRPNNPRIEKRGGVRNNI